MSTTPGTRLDFKTVRIRARYDDDTAARGKVTFTRTGGPLKDTGEHEFLLPKPVVVDLDNQGEGTVVLGVTDDPDLNPSGWTWTAKFEITGTNWPDFTFSLPDSLPETVWLDTLAPTTSVNPGFTFVLANDPRLGALIPGGTTGQALVKASNDDYDTEWSDTAGGGTTLPNGGNAGQALVKTSSQNQAVGWGVPTVPNDLPVGGTTGQVLSKTTGNNYEVGWVTPATTAAGISYAGGPDLSASTVEVALDVLAGRVTPVNNGTNATPVRPAGVTVVLWTGTVRPTASMAAADIYVGDVGAGGGSVSFGPPTGNVDIGDAAVTGVATAATRADHQHATPAPPTGYPVDVGPSRLDGTATTPARSDHRHTIGPGTITGAMVSATAAIARGALALAAVDSPANVGSERTLGTGAQQAAQGTLGMTATGQIPVMGPAGRTHIPLSFPGWFLMANPGTAIPEWVQGIRKVSHGTNGSLARPTADCVYWVGTATPVNMDESLGDFWNDLGG